MNAAQAKYLIDVAQKKKLFLMEAVWTRFFPIVSQIRKLVHEDRVLGKVVRVFSDLSMPFPPDVTSRLFDPKLGGGAMLDLGVYALVWQLMILYSHPDNHNSFPKITSSMIKTPLTGVDEQTAMVLDFPELHAQGMSSQPPRTLAMHRVVENALETCDAMRVSWLDPLLTPILFALWHGRYCHDVHERADAQAVRGVHSR